MNDESLTEKIIGAAHKVLFALKPGLDEKLYERALIIELIQELREIEGVAGVHVMAIEWEEAVKPIVEGAGLLPRPQP